MLFERPFFEYMHRALKPGGALCTQAESLWLHMPTILKLAEMCKDIFGRGSVHYGFTTIPTYPSGQIGFMICAKAQGDEAVDMRAQRRRIGGGSCKYYNADVHQAAFILPQFAVDALAANLTFQRSPEQ